MFINRAAAKLANEPLDKLTLEQLGVWDLLNKRILF